VVTADHGNADQLFNPDTDGPHTAHTLNPVELVISSPGNQPLGLKPSGKLGDIAPTILKLMGLPLPDAMTGTCLLQ
jgi:2,3-bisphosphoglycerate-independent phosphoglycerate mutase